MRNLFEISRSLNMCRKDLYNLGANYIGGKVTHRCYKNAVVNICVQIKSRKLCIKLKFPTVRMMHSDEVGYPPQDTDPVFTPESWVQYRSFLLMHNLDFLVQIYFTDLQKLIYNYKCWNYLWTSQAFFYWPYCEPISFDLSFDPKGHAHCKRRVREVKRSESSLGGVGRSRL